MFANTINLHNCFRLLLKSFMQQSAARTSVITECLDGLLKHQHYATTQPRVNAYIYIQEILTTDENTGERASSKRHQREDIETRGEPHMAHVWQSHTRSSSRADQEKHHVILPELQTD